MICPHCEFEFDTPAAHCPECGIRIVRKISGIVKTSTVMIATGNENNFYRSLQDVPEALRRQLIETTNSENSGMIVIADRAGKEQWTEIVAHREAQQSVAVQPESLASVEETAAPARGFAGLSWSAWAGVLLFLAAGAMIASMFQVFHFGR
jgi:predicted LPLAT superfamily acyltransferase